MECCHWSRLSLQSTECIRRHFAVHIVTMVTSVNTSDFDNFAALSLLQMKFIFILTYFDIEIM